MSIDYLTIQRYVPAPETIQRAARHVATKSVGPDAPGTEHRGWLIEKAVLLKCRTANFFSSLCSGMRGDQSRTKRQMVRAPTQHAAWSLQTASCPVAGRPAGMTRQRTSSQVECVLQTAMLHYQDEASSETQRTMIEKKCSADIPPAEICALFSASRHSTFRQLQETPIGVNTRYANRQELQYLANSKAADRITLLFFERNGATPSHCGYFRQTAKSANEKLSMLVHGNVAGRPAPGPDSARVQRQYESCLADRLDCMTLGRSNAMASVAHAPSGYMTDLFDKENSATFKTLCLSTRPASNGEFMKASKLSYASAITQLKRKIASDADCAFFAEESKITHKLLATYLDEDHKNPALATLRPIPW